MIVWASLSLFFVGVWSQTYYLGDPITVSFRPETVFGPSVTTIKTFEIQFANSNTVIKFDTKDVPILHRHLMHHIPLYSNFGTQVNSQQAPATMSGKATIVGISGTNKMGVLMNVTVGRHIAPVDTTVGRIEKLSARSNGPFVVEYFGTEMGNLSDPAMWVVQLVETMAATQTFKQYDTFTVTSVQRMSLNTSILFTLSGSWSATAPKPKGGLFFLVGAKNGTSTKFNTYGITGASTQTQYSWVLVNSSFAVNVPASTIEFSLTKISMNGGGVNNYWWILATDAKTNVQYALGCSAAMASSYANFEWRVLTVDGVRNVLPVGTYNIDVVYSSSNQHHSMFVDGANPTMRIAGKTLTVVNHPVNMATPITFNGHNSQTLGDLSPNKNLSVQVYSIFSTMYVQWFKASANYTNSSNGNGTNNWKPDGPPMMVMFSTPGVNKTIYLSVPSDVLKNITTATKKARLYGWAEDCSGVHYAQSHAAGNLLFPPSPTNAPSNSSNKLGAGAIVGIVCAVVFVCGVAAWWLCMKNSGNNDRYQKLDGH